MRSKAEIEQQLQHFKTGACTKHGTAENKYWIAALEWVLGDEAHRKAYEEWLASLEALLPNASSPMVEQSVTIAFKLLLNQLR